MITVSVGNPYNPLLGTNCYSVGGKSKRYIWIIFIHGFFSPHVSSCFSGAIVSPFPFTACRHYRRCSKHHWQMSSASVPSSVLVKRPSNGKHHWTSFGALLATEKMGVPWGIGYLPYIKGIIYIYFRFLIGDFTANPPQTRGKTPGPIPFPKVILNLLLDTTYPFCVLGVSFVFRFPVVATQIFLEFSPLCWGRWTRFDEHIFQMGWKKPPTSLTWNLESGTLG